MSIKKGKKDIAVTSVKDEKQVAKQANTAKAAEPAVSANANSDNAVQSEAIADYSSHESTAPTEQKKANLAPLETNSSTVSEESAPSSLGSTAPTEPVPTAPNTASLVSPFAPEPKPSPRSSRDSKPSKETTVSIPLDKIQPFENHPFLVEQDEDMEELKSSIRANGVVTPPIVRPLPNGNYEMISGHRRMAACKALGEKTMQVFVRTLSYDEAVLMMVESNQQRAHFRTSEKARAYAMRDQALKHLRAGQNVPSVGRVTDQIGKDNGESGRNVRRYIHMARLIPPLLQLVDDKKLGKTTAEHLSFLPKKEQEMVYSVIEAEQSVPRPEQGKQLKELYAEGNLDEETLLRVLATERDKPSEKLAIPMETLERFFRHDETPAKMIEMIVKALELAERKKQRDRQSER
ncbi:MAG: ParB/RepB/Spo0J family partition protein [Clostridia bacterium]|nr:ParB/RepB/Spo0J family partition protein [Clostridia bacterium]